MKDENGSTAILLTPPDALAPADNDRPQSAQATVVKTDISPIPCPPSSFVPACVWRLVLLGLVLWHGWMTLSLFGPDHRWKRLVDDQPILSGSHALHLYHGYLGARSIRESGSTCSYDPHFQAGYLKTPVFDSGSRPAELFLWLAGAKFRPAAYKIGLAVCCLTVPLLLAWAALAMGLGRGVSCLASGLGLLVWWSAPCRTSLEIGDLDLLLASMVAVVHGALLLRFDRQPGVLCWLGVLGTGIVGWFAQPWLFVVLLPLALVYYLSVGARHQLQWHLALMIGLAGAVFVNYHWLSSWVRFCWMSTPLQVNVPLLLHPTFNTIWRASLWGGPPDRTFAVALLGLTAVGGLLLNQRRRRACARYFGLGTAGLLMLAVAGIVWEPLGEMGTHRLLVPALFFAILPAVHALAEGYRLLLFWTGGLMRCNLILGSVLLIGGLTLHQHVPTLTQRCLGTTPLLIGLGPEREAIVTTLAEHTGLEARILWEDRSRQPEAARWTPLLPVLVEARARQMREHRQTTANGSQVWQGRASYAFVGGLDPDAKIDHTRLGFTDHHRTGKSLAEWTDAELEAFCKRYNIGWVVCWSPAGKARIEKWKDADGKNQAERLAELHDEGSGSLFRLSRKPALARKGKAQLLHAGLNYIVLADVVPDGEEVLLSLHYHKGMQAAPGRVHIEPETEPHAPIPFVRLRTTGPVARVTLTWQAP